METAKAWTGSVVYWLEIITNYMCVVEEIL